MLRRGDNLSPHQQQAVATASAEAERTIRMLQDLLYLARVDSGNLHFRLNPIMLNTLVVEVAEMSQQVSNRPIKVLTTDDDVIACADQDRLEQVLINLVDNAIKYSSPDQAVELILEKTEKQVVIHVRDRQLIQLTAKEFDLLELLMRHPRQVLTRDQILEKVWGYDFMGESNVIEIYVRALRIKLEADNLKRLIHTIRGVGYVLRGNL